MSERESKVVDKQSRVFDPTVVEVDDSRYVVENDLFSTTVAKTDNQEVGEFYLAESNAERYQGLSGFESLDKEGMVFKYPEKECHRLVFRDMSFPLDVLFLDEDGNIVDRGELDEDNPATESVCLYALEVEKGWIDDNDISLTDSFSFGGSIEKSTPEGVPDSADYVAPGREVSDDVETVESEYGGTYIVSDEQEESEQEFSNTELLPDDVSQNDLENAYGNLEDAPEYDEDNPEFRPAFGGNSGGASEGDVVAFSAYGEESRDADLEYSDTLNAVKVSEREWATDDIFMNQDGELFEVEFGGDPEDYGFDDPFEDFDAGGVSAEAVYKPVGTKDADTVEVDREVPDQQVDLDNVPDVNTGAFNDELMEKRDQTVETLRESHPDEAVDAFEEQMSEWWDPTQSYMEVPELWTAAAAFSGANQIPDEFNDEQLDRAMNVSDEVLGVYSDFFRMSQEAFKEEFGEDGVTLYRGLDSDLTREYGEREENGISLTPQALESWTLERNNASGYGNRTIEAEIEPEDVAVFGAIGLGLRDEEYREVTLFGDEEYVVPEEWDNAEAVEHPRQASDTFPIDKLPIENMMPASYSDALYETDDTQTEKQSGEWEPYEGPRGGFGWRNTETDDIVYQDQPPGEMDLSNLSPSQAQQLQEELGIEEDQPPENMIDVDAEDIEPGDYVRVGDEEGQVELVDRVGDDVYLTFDALDGAWVSEEDDVYIDDSYEEDDSVLETRQRIEESFEIEEVDGITIGATTEDVIRAVEENIDRVKQEQVADNVLEKMNTISRSDGGNYYSHQESLLNLRSGGMEKTLHHEIGHALFGENGFKPQEGSNVLAYAHHKASNAAQVHRTVEYDLETDGRTVEDAVRSLVDNNLLGEQWTGYVMDGRIDGDIEFNEDLFKVQYDETETSEEMKDLASAVNTAWEEQYEKVKNMESFGGIGNTYSAMNAHETLAMLHEEMQSEGVMTIDDIHDEYSELLDAYLDVFDVPEHVMRSLNDKYEESPNESMFDEMPFEGVGGL